MKQMALEKNTTINVCINEKGEEVGAHILSGNVFEPTALNELFPNWKELDPPIDTPVTEEAFYLLSEKKSFSIPHLFLPNQFRNHGNYVISLSKLTRWLASKAEEVGH